MNNPPTCRGDTGVARRQYIPTDRAADGPGFGAPFPLSPCQMPPPWAVPCDPRAVVVFLVTRVFLTVRMPPFVMPAPWTVTPRCWSGCATI